MCTADRAQEGRVGHEMEWKEPSLVVEELNEVCLQSAHLHHALGETSVRRERCLQAATDVKLAVGGRALEPFQ